MSKKRNILQADVHIAPCNGSCLAKECKILQKLATEILKLNLTCLSEYPLSGKYSSRFKEAFTNCSYTVLHKCPKLWDRVKKLPDLQDILSDEEKILTLQFENSKVEDVTEFWSNEDHLQFKVFFEDRMTFVITGQENLTDFAERISDLFIGEDTNNVALSNTIEEISKTVTSKSSSPLSPHHSLQSLTTSNLSVSEVFTESEASYLEPKLTNVYQIFDNVYGIKDIHVHRSIRLSHSKLPPSLPDDRLKLQEDIDSSFSCSKEDRLTLWLSIMSEILPLMFEHHDMFGLVCVVTCDCECESKILADRAASLLELMFLQSPQNTDHYLYSFDELKSVILLLQSHLSKLRREYQQMKKQSFLPTVKRLSCIQLLAMWQLVELGQDKKSLVKCNDLFDTLYGQLLASGAVPAIDTMLTHLDDFVKHVKDKKCAHFYKKVEEIKLQCVEDLFLKEVLKEPFPYFAAALIEYTKAMFITGNTVSIEFIEKFLTASPKLRFALCHDVLKFGLTNTIVKGHWQSTGSNISPICLHLMKLFHCMTQKEHNKPYEVQLYTSLIFDKKPPIQSEVLKKLNSFPVAAVRQALVQEVQLWLQPLMVISDHQFHDIKLQQHWSISSGTFNNCPCLLHVNKLPQVITAVPNVLDLLNDQDLNLWQLQQILQLDHPNIMTVMAYQETGLPQMYVSEDYLRRNLQTTMKNQVDKREYLPREDLFRYVIEVSSALKYCHSRELVHCNLTAASVFISELGPAKLCGFHLCHSMTDGKFIGHNISESRPYRWTAPESLSHLEHSKASDVWMVGHLLFEVLSHGMMPYADQDNISSLIQNIIRAKTTLFRQTCFEDQLWHLIKKCTRLEPGLRLCLEDIENELTILRSNCNSDMKTQIQYLNDRTWRSSVNYEVGSYPQCETGGDGGGDMPKEIEPEKKKRDIRDISDRITRWSVEESFVFKEKLLSRWSSDMVTRLDQLKTVLPQFEFHVKSSELPHLEICIPLDCLGSLSTVTSTLKLGQGLASYFLCLWRVAALLKKLHSLGWVLGDFCADHLYVETMAKGPKVHITSLAYLWYCDDIPVVAGVPEEQEVCDRAAPEVQRQGLFSPATDIFTFGCLIQDVLKKYQDAQLLAQEQPPPTVLYKDWGNVSLEGSSYKTYIANWQSLWHISEQCMSQEADHRPTSQLLLEQICKTLQQDYQIDTTQEDTVLLQDGNENVCKP